MQSNVIGGAGWTCWTLIVVMMLSLVCVYLRIIIVHIESCLFGCVCVFVCVCLFVRLFIYIFVLYIETHTQTPNTYVMLHIIDF